MTGQIVLSQAQANLKMTLWQAEADSITNSDLYVWLSEIGLPPEVALRLHELVTFTKKVGSKVLAVGKILLIKILEFVKAHPFLVAGIGIGATVGAAVASLITAVPFVGQLLAPVAMALGITVGAVVGHRLDKRFPGVGEDIFEIAQEFFKLLTNVFQAIFREVITA